MATYHSASQESGRTNKSPVAVSRPAYSPIGSENDGTADPRICAVDQKAPNAGQRTKTTQMNYQTCQSITTGEKSEMERASAEASELPATYDPIANFNHNLWPMSLAGLVLSGLFILILYVIAMSKEDPTIASEDFEVYAKATYVSYVLALAGAIVAVMRRESAPVNDVCVGFLLGFAYGSGRLLILGLIHLKEGSFTGEERVAWPLSLFDIHSWCVITSTLMSYVA